MGEFRLHCCQKQRFSLNIFRYIDGLRAKIEPILAKPATENSATLCEPQTCNNMELVEVQKKKEPY